MSKTHSPLQLSLSLRVNDEDHHHHDVELALPSSVPVVPSLWGIPLKYLSLVTLAVQNSALTIIMHYSRVSTPASRTYSAATAVLMNEVLKGLISLIIAFSRIDTSTMWNEGGSTSHGQGQRPFVPTLLYRARRLRRDVFSHDCWKLSIPAILYVIQNNLQYLAASNLDVATFQVTYQMKILTTAAFSVMLLRKKLSPTQWLSLVCLAIGVGIVQIQGGAPSSTAGGMHVMSCMKGFVAVTAACFTSGLAGVYFEMVLKNSQADLWVRNVQLSLFSLLPALAPIIFTQRTQISAAGESLITTLFANFGASAWATVLVQVIGGLVTAMVIKYSDNIMKGFATSLSIVISFLASVALFDFQMSITFVLGSSIVLIATWLYNQQASVRVGSSVAPETWIYLRNEKLKEDFLRSPPPVSRRVSLTAVSSTTSISSMASSFTAAPSLSMSDSDIKTFR